MKHILVKGNFFIFYSRITEIPYYQPREWQAVYLYGKMTS